MADESTLSLPMSWTWRLCFISLAGLGALALGWGALALVGIDFGHPSNPPEQWTAIIAGVLLQPFSWSALRHGTLRLTGDELHYLKYGFVCRTAALELARIERFGVGLEKSSGGGDEQILIIETREGATVRLKLAMYDDTDPLLAQIAARTGLTASPTRRTLAGARFADPE